MIKETEFILLKLFSKGTHTDTRLREMLMKQEKLREDKERYKSLPNKNPVDNV